VRSAEGNQCSSTLPARSKLNVEQGGRNGSIGNFQYAADGSPPAVQIRAVLAKLSELCWPEPVRRAQSLPDGQTDGSPVYRAFRCGTGAAAGVPGVGPSMTLA
jgi:hypothetical protein